MLTKWYSAICIQYFEKPLPQPEKKSNRKIEENPNLYFAKYHLYTEEEAHNLDYQQSLFFFWSVEQNARDTQMTTRVAYAAQRSRARALPLLNLKKKRG